MGSCVGAEMPSTTMLPPKIWEVSATSARRFAADFSTLAKIGLCQTHVITHAKHDKECRRLKLSFCSLRMPLTRYLAGSQRSRTHTLSFLDCPPASLISVTASL